MSSDQEYRRSCIWTFPSSSDLPTGGRKPEKLVLLYPSRILFIISHFRPIKRRSLHNRMQEPWHLPCPPSLSVCLLPFTCPPPLSDLSPSSFHSTFFSHSSKAPGAPLSLGLCFCSSLCREWASVRPWAVSLDSGLWSKVTSSVKSFLTTCFKMATCLLTAALPFPSPAVEFLVRHADVDTDT